jgi:hypothetical protein
MPTFLDKLTAELNIDNIFSIELCELSTSSHESRLVSDPAFMAHLSHSLVLRSLAIPVEQLQHPPILNPRPLFM